MDWNYWKKKFPWLTRAVFLVFIGSALMLISNSLTPKENQNQAPVTTEKSIDGTLAQSEKDIATRLESAIKEMEGVGNVSVTVFLAAGPHFHYAQNGNTTGRSIEEKDKSGLNRLTKENNASSELVLIKDGASSVEKPVILSEDQGEIKGILIVADGATSSRVKREITELVADLLNIPAYKVNVEAGKGGALIGNNER